MLAMQLPVRSNSQGRAVFGELGLGSIFVCSCCVGGAALWREFC